MKDTSKRWLGILSFVPIAALLIWVVYVIIINNRLVENQQMHQHEKVVTLLFNNYGGNAFLFMLAFLIGLAVFLTLVVHLKKVRTMNGSTKLAWIAFMIIFGPLAFPVYYFIEILHEPDDVPMYGSLEEGMG
jgi:uncharacterized membrane protein YhaH (DUF805 family)